MKPHCHKDMKKPRKTCTRCGHEALDWMPFVRINEETVCGMCIQLALGAQDELNAQRNQRICVYMSRPAGEDTPLRCDECGTGPHPKSPILVVRTIRICSRCFLRNLAMLRAARKRAAVSARIFKEQRN